ncbi:MAG: GntR family transcriptional regulator [Acidimicrobiales bacterium]
MRSRRRGGLADEIVTHIRAQVLGGEMRPGQKVDQDAIAEALDVSRSPIREALVVLGKEGLLDITPRRGAFVAKLTPADVIDHYELFGLVSGRVAAMAAESFTDDQMHELSAIHERFSSAQRDEHSKLNEEFHRLINSAAPRRTRWLLRHLEQSIPAGFFGLTPGWGERAVSGHQAIVDAVAAREPEMARRAMDAHHHEAGVAAVRALEARGFWEVASDD